MPSTKVRKQCYVWSFHLTIARLQITLSLRPIYWRRTCDILSADNWIDFSLKNRLLFQIWSLLGSHCDACREQRFQWTVIQLSSLKEQIKPIPFAGRFIKVSPPKIGILPARKAASSKSCWAIGDSSLGCLIICLFPVGLCLPWPPPAK